MAAVQSLRVLRRKIRSVVNIRKITRAMQMVSAAKLRRAQDRLLAVRPYADKMAELLGRIAARAGRVRHPFFEPRPQVRAIRLFVISADKGLCGAYNANVIRMAERLVRERSVPAGLHLIGRKAAEYFPRRGYVVAATHTFLPIEVPFATIQQMLRPALEAYLAGEADEIHVAYTRYVNALTFRAEAVRFVPVEAPPEAQADEDVIFEPEPERILGALVPRYVETVFQRILLESFSSEHASRMNAMKNATDNAEELIETLTLQANKARQTSITKELLDIVGGAEALKG